MIRLYIYDTETGEFKHIIEGLAYIVTTMVVDGEDYTLTSPPDYLHTWYWNDDKWQLTPTQNGV